ncbi:hypothetical protein [Chitinophaga sp. OAE865]|uniref:hypothetical protein n=1 Tax=Chitinophaga sp. OAE865 TaxID=2817898 RepID=UPI001AE9D2F3
MTLLLETILWTQGIYFLATGMWPLVHYGSFEAITGHKTDVWLVKTVGMLLAVTGAALLIAVMDRRPVDAFTFTIGAGTALGLLTIDIIYVVKKVISKIYLLDACVQLLLIALWCINIF